MTAARRKLCRISLTADGRAALEDSADSGKGSKERRRRAEILLLADVARKGGGRADAGIADALRVGTATAGRVRKRFALEGPEAALERRARKNRKPRLLDGAGEARLAVPACSPPPPGRARWTLRLLGEKPAELEAAPSWKLQRAFPTRRFGGF